MKAGKGKKSKVRYAHNVYDDKTHTDTSTIETETIVLDPKELKDIVYFMPCPKSPHGCDVDPTGEYICGSGKLAAMIPVFSFSKIQKAIADQSFEGSVPLISAPRRRGAVRRGEKTRPRPFAHRVRRQRLCLHLVFRLSEIVKWNIEKLEVVDRVPTYYSIGHLSIPGGPTRKPHGKYVIAYNKITKDRYLPTGPELTQSAQLYDISGDKMKLLLDFPTTGEPHYAEAIPASLVASKSVKIFKIEENQHPYVAKGEKEARCSAKGNKVHVNMTTIRSHFVPDNIEGVKLGDEVYFHVTNLEQDWDVPHGFAVKGANNAEILVMPGETCTLKWVPDRIGLVAFYCTDFCSALHQEMQGYIRVSPRGSSVPITFSTGNKTEPTGATK